MQKECIFCKIAKKELPSTIIYEDNYIIAFKDINPQAKIHILVIPKKHYKDITHTPQECIDKLFNAIKKITEQIPELKNGFRLVTNTKEMAGQTIFHIHFHILGGEQLSPKMA